MIVSSPIRKIIRKNIPWLKNLFGISVPLISRLMSFIALPFMINFFSIKDYISISFNVIIATGIATIAGLGIAPRLIKIILEKNFLEKEFTLRLSRKFLAIWALFIVALFVPTFHIAAYLNLSPVLIFISILEGFLMSASNDFILPVLQARNLYPEIYKYSIVSTVLLLPIRIFLVTTLDLSVIYWCALGCIIRITFLIHYYIKEIKSTYKTSPVETRVEFNIVSIDSLIIFFAIGFWGISCMDRILATHLLEPREVAAYQIVFQYTSIVGILLTQSNYINFQKQKFAIKTKTLTATLSLQIEHMLVTSFLAMFCLIVFHSFLFQRNLNEIFSILPTLVLAQFMWGPIQIWYNIHGVLGGKLAHMASFPLVGIFAQLIFVTISLRSHSLFTLRYLANMTLVGYASSLIVAIIADALFFGSNLFSAFVNSWIIFWLLLLSTFVIFSYFSFNWVSTQAIVLESVIAFFATYKYIILNMKISKQ